MVMIDREAMVPTIEKAIEGEQLAFETLFKTYWNKAYFYCLKYFKNQSEAEDATQEAFFILFRDIGKLKNPKSFNAYLSRILSNVCYDQTKKWKSIRNDTIFSIDNFAESLAEEREEFLPEEIMHQKEQKDHVLRLIDELPNKQRETMLLYYLHDLSQSEIAVALDVKPSIVGDRIYNAKATLREKLKQRNADNVLYTSSIVTIPIITQILMEEMEILATPDVQDRIWEDLQVQINAYNAAEASINCQSTSNSSSIINTAIIGLACVAIVCFTVLYINYSNYTCKNEPNICPNAQGCSFDILSELRAVTTLDEFNNFVVRHNFVMNKIFVRNHIAGETRYHLYQRELSHMTIITGIRIDTDDILIIYEILSPGDLPPEDVVIWFNENID